MKNVIHLHLPNFIAYHQLHGDFIFQVTMPGSTTRSTNGPGNARSRSGRQLPRQVRRWVFTLNNYTDAELVEIAEEIAVPSMVTRLMYGKEVGANGTPHLQGCAYGS